MIDPVILEHFRTLKERGELDAILPEILTGMGLEVLSRATIGNRQYGADVTAVGKDEDGKRKLFLFSVKRGDLSRSEWNGGSDQALRPSLDEIRDAYMRTVAPEHKKLPVVIVLVVGGVVPEPVLPLVTGYMQEKEDERFVYRLWTGDTLTQRLLGGALREEIFPADRRALLRKTAALVEQPEMALRHFGKLLEDVFSDSTIPAEAQVRTILMATWVAFSWGREAENLEVAFDASEQLVLRAWEVLYPVIEADRSRKQSASHVFLAVVRLHLEVWQAYIGEKVLPRADVMHALSFAVGSVEPVDINLALFELVGRIATIGLLKLWMVPGSPALPAIADSKDAEVHTITCGPDQIATAVPNFSLPEDDQQTLGLGLQAKEVAQALAKLPETNPTLRAPMLDRHSTDLGLALLLLSCFEDTREAAAYWTRQAANALMIAVSVRENGPRLPSINSSYEALLDKEGPVTDKEFADATAASTLLPLYALCAKILGEEKLVAELAHFQKKHMAHTNAQGWVPNSRSDQKMWAGHERDGSALQDLEIGENGDMLISALKRECAENTAWPNLSAVRLGHWPLVAIACRRNRTPIPPQLWMGLI